MPARPMFRFLLASLAFAAAAVPSGAQQKVDSHRAVTSDASIRLSGGFASLRIIGWDRDSLALTGSLGKGARFEGAFGGVATAPARGVKMFIEAPEGVVTGKLELRVPAKARVWIKAGSADIEVSGVTGGLDLNIVGGSIVVAGNPRELNAESMDGSVTVDGTASWLRVKTATGDVTLRGGGEDVGVNTISGTIRVASGNYDRVRLEAVTSGIVYAGEVVRGASLHFETHSGPIEVRLASRVDSEVDAMTVTGTIENTATSARPVPGREKRGAELGFGAGSARIVIRSFKGNIALRGR